MRILFLNSDVPRIDGLVDVTLLSYLTEFVAFTHGVNRIPLPHDKDRQHGNTAEFLFMIVR